MAKTGLRDAQIKSLQCKGLVERGIERGIPATRVRTMCRSTRALCPVPHMSLLLGLNLSEVRMRVSKPSQSKGISQFCSDFGGDSWRFGFWHLCNAIY